jgi:hypothetical protein
MPKTPLSKTLAPLLALALLLALPIAAEANIAFVRGGANSAVYTASNSGKSVKKVDGGRNPHLDPNGATLAYFHESASHKPELKLTTVGAGAGTTLMSGWQEPFELEWSPNSEFILAERGPEIGKRKLVLITVATGAQKVLATGYFLGFGFDSEGQQVVYAKATNEKYPPRTDVFLVAAGGKATPLTKDHISAYPLWGPTGKIVFIKLLEANKRQYGPKNELYLMSESGKGVKRLTHTKVDPLLQGLFPTAWSGNGKRILAQFGGQDTSYAVGVNAQSGAQKPVIEATEEGLVGSAISFNGQTVFGYEGGFDPGNPHNVVSVTGGKTKVLVRNGAEPSFGD